MFHETLSNRVHQNIICFLNVAFITPQAVLEKIPLPFDLELLGGPFLPFADNLLQRFTGWGKGEQRVQMIWHQKEDMRPPNELFLPMVNGSKKQFGDLTLRQLVLTAFPTVDCDKINFPLRINP